MSSVLVHSSNQSTDALAKIGVDNITHTSARFIWKNISSTSSHYRLVHKPWSSSSWVSNPSESVTVSGSTSKTVYLTGLEANQSYNVRLERQENGSWVPQSHLVVRTHAVVTGESTSSTAAVIKWDSVYPSSVYRAQLYNSVPTPYIAPVRTLDASEVVLSDSSHVLVVSSLLKNQRYYAVIEANEEVDISGKKSFVPIKTVVFETSDLVDLTVSSPSGTFVDLSWDGTKAGDDEEDSVAQFQIDMWKRIGTNWKYQELVMDWSPDSVKSLRVNNLDPGERYVFNLHREGVDGVKVRQSQQIIETPTTSIGLAGPTTTTRTKVEWPPMYSNARYQVRYVAQGKSPKVFGGDTGTTTNEALLTNLDPETEYTIELLVVENGSTHTVSTMTTKTQKSPPVLCHWIRVHFHRDGPREPSRRNDELLLQDRSQGIFGNVWCFSIPDFLSTNQGVNPEYRVSGYPIQARIWELGTPTER